VPAHEQRPVVVLHTPPKRHWELAVQWHCEPWQEKLGAHARPQAPQLAGSLVRSRQPDGLSQHTTPGASPQLVAWLHAHTSTPPTCMQASPATHVVLAQRQRSVAVSQVPPDPPCRQRELLPLQVQALASWAPHIRPPAPVLCWLHELVQPPQFALSLLTSISQPLSAAGAAGRVQLA